MNKDFKRRDELLNLINEQYECGGIVSFDNLDVETFKKLLDEDFVDPNRRQNYSPTAYEFYEFMVKYPQLKAIGYAVSPKRSDYRISIEGLICSDDISDELKIEFKEFCEEADELMVKTTRLRAWWD